MSNNVFITYSHPNESAEPANRRRVARHIAIHHRNRSAPTSRIRPGTQTRQIRRLAPVITQPEQVASLPHDEQLPSLSLRFIPRDHYGFRMDPFSVLPTGTGYIGMAAIDYYIHSYAPDHLVRPELVSVETGFALIRQHFQYALQRPVMLESILALACSTLSKMSTNEDATSIRLQAIFHYGRAVKLLREALSNGYMGDAALFAIMSIMVVNYLWNDLTAFEANLTGLRQIIALRGGLDNLAWPTLLRPSILSLESFWTYLSSQAHLMGRVTLPAVVTNEFTPFQGDIEALISTLPLGFRMLAESQRLSIDLLPIIQREAVLDASLSRTPPSSFVYHDGVRKFAHLKTQNGDEVTFASNLQTCEELARLLTNHGLMPLDIVCCIGLFINSLCITRSEQLSPIYFTQLQHHAKQLMDCSLTDDDSPARDLITWTIFNVASTMVPGRLTVQSSMYQDDFRLSLAVKVVNHFSASSWGDMQSILRRFICSDTCLDAFENVWDTGLLHMNGSQSSPAVVMS